MSAGFKKNIFNPLVVTGIIVLILSFALPPFPAIGAGLPPALQQMVRNGGFMVQKGNATILAHNADARLVPASIWKIGTALAALRHLGPEYRFTTNFYRDSMDNLYIQGQGDPGLISEEIGLIAAALRENGLKRVMNIYLDDSAFDVGPVPGMDNSLNPYDATNGALIVNFNTVSITKNPDGAVSSGEPQTPLLPLMTSLAQEVGPGSHRINVSHRSGNGLRYVGELVRALLAQNSITGEGIIERRQPLKDLKPFYLHHSSKTLAEVIGGMLQYSNNFTANQLFLKEGARQFGLPATLAKGRQAMEHFLYQELDLGKAEASVDEGSGLSRDNTVTPAAMIKILTAFKPYAQLLPEIHGLLAKSGTLKGVYSYAGYFREGERLDSFVLMLNQEKNTRDPLLDSLYSLYKKSIKKIKVQEEAFR